MRRKRLAVWMLAASMAFTLFPTTAFAAKGDLVDSENTGDTGHSENAGRPGDSGHPDDAGRPGDSGHPDDTGRPGGKDDDVNVPIYSSTEITIPENLLDGNYSGTATVHPNEEQDFEDYDITVTVTIEDGVLTTFSVLGVNKENSKYSGNAQTGILNQITSSDNNTGVYEIDAVSNATCSTTAIVQGINAALAEGEALSGTYYSMDNEVAYNPSGSSLLVTVHNPDEDIDYDISLSYGVGKFSDDLEPANDYCSVELISESESEKVYQITMKPGAVYEINDDDMIHKLYINNPGTSLAVKVNNVNIGTFTIKSSATPSITNNVLSLTGGNGDTLADYLSLINEVTVVYTDENGDEVTTTYTTTWQHDMDPAFVGSDLFNADGSINFDLVAKVTVTGDDFEAIQDENGNNVTTDVVVFPYGAKGDYLITVSAGDGYEDVTAQVGGSNVPEDPKTDEPTIDDTKDTNTTTGNSSTSSSNTSSTTTAAKADNTVPKTSDTAPLAMWTGILALAVMSMGIVFVRRRRHS